MTRRSALSRRIASARRLTVLAAVLTLAGCQTVPQKTAGPVAAQPAPPSVPVPPAKAAAGPTRIMPWLKTADWSDLPGWQDDDLAAAWPAFIQSCRTLQRQPSWLDVCTAAGRQAPTDSDTLRDWFESRFNVYRIQQADGSGDGLITGYYEPLLHGSRTLTPTYRYPVYGPPDDLLLIDLSSLYPELKNLRLRGRLDGRKVVPYYTRQEIDSGKAPVRGKELAWVDDPVALFFLQVQGSGRIQMEDGSLLRVGYADQNGYPYRSIGRWLVDHGELTLDKASMEGIEDWARRNPDRLPELLSANPSYVFFRILPDSGGGPLGALGVPLTPERSIAVDPNALPLGAPVWLATTQPDSTEPLDRLVMAQDTGGAIRGNVRADFFWGFGDEAGQKAGAMKQKGQMWLLLPKTYPLTITNVPAQN